MNKKAQIGVIVALVILVIVLVGALILSQLGNLSITGKAISANFEDSYVISQTYEISDFKNIKILGKGNLFLTQSDEYFVEIEAEENILEILDVRVEGDTLVIGKKRTLFLSRKPIDIHVTMPEVEEISVTGSGKIESQNQIKGNELSIKISGSGKIDMFVDVIELKTKISGSGDANYKGTANKHDVTVSGSGDINAFELMTEETKVTISGSGSAEIFATDELDIKVSGSGKVKYKGNPDISQSISGSGKVERV